MRKSEQMEDLADEVVLPSETAMEADASIRLTNPTCGILDHVSPGWAGSCCPSDAVEKRPIVQKVNVAYWSLVSTCWDQSNGSAVRGVGAKVARTGLECASSRFWVEEHHSHQ
jgi:hypothetical protein